MNRGRRGLEAVIFLLAATCLSPAFAQDIDTLKKRALKGDDSAAITVGMKYRDGNGVGRNYREALRWYRLASDRGDAGAYDHVGWMYLQGYGVRKNVDIAIGYFTASASKGHAQALYNLGNIFFDGIGKKKDLTRAFGYYLDAARKDHTSSQIEVASCYQEGQGVARNPGQAVFWYKKALERGHKGACWPLGVLYYEGKGVRQDVSRARELWSIAKTRRSYAFHVTPEEIDALEHKGSKAEKHAFLRMRHILQGHNMCAPTSAAMTLNYYGFKCDPYQIKQKCPKSPVGTGTGWDKLVIGIEAVSGKKWQTAEVPYDDAGFDDGLARTKANLDKGFPVLVDIREGGAGQRPQGSAHTVVAIGYDESKRVIYFQDPAIKYPGVRAFPYEHFKRSWNSQWYRSDASGKIVRPFILTSWKD